MRIPPLKIKMTLESNPLKSIMLVERLALALLVPPDGRKRSLVPPDGQIYEATNRGSLFSLILQNVYINTAK